MSRAGRKIPDPESARVAMYPGFILASASPRRHELLISAGLQFEVDPADVREQPQAGETPVEYVRRMSEEKGQQVWQRRRAGGDTRPVLAADTVVVLDGRILEKPADRSDARGMLRSLSGREHEVITGFCILGERGVVQRQEVTTRVRFRDLSEQEIGAYLDTGEWRDKAGAYAIQGRAAHMAASIAGSYTNVVGLPLAQALEALHRARERAAGTDGNTGGNPPDDQGIEKP